MRQDVYQPTAAFARGRGARRVEKAGIVAVGGGRLEPQLPDMGLSRGSTSNRDGQHTRYRHCYLRVSSPE
jgi:hypothetical protein